MRLLSAFRAAAAVFALSSAPVSAIVIDFESVSSGTPTPFTATQGGVSAAFSSTPGTFFVGAGFFSALTGQVLLDDDASQLNSLNIAFTEGLSSLSLLFALNNPAGSGNLFLTAYSGGIGGTTVGSTSAAGTVPVGFTYPEGLLTFAGGVFDAVTITSDQPDFAIDNIDLTPNVIPEPGTVGLLLTGLAGLVALHRRRPARAL